MWRRFKHHKEGDTSKKPAEELVSSSSNFDIHKHLHGLGSASASGSERSSSDIQETSEINDKSKRLKACKADLKKVKEHFGKYYNKNDQIYSQILKIEERLKGNLKEKDIYTIEEGIKSCKELILVKEQNTAKYGTRLNTDQYGMIGSDERKGSQSSGDEINTQETWEEQKRSLIGIMEKYKEDSKVMECIRDIIQEVVERKGIPEINLVTEDCSSLKSSETLKEIEAIKEINNKINEYLKSVSIYKLIYELQNWFFAHHNDQYREKVNKVVEKANQKFKEFEKANDWQACAKCMEERYKEFEDIINEKESSLKASNNPVDHSNVSSQEFGADTLVKLECKSHGERSSEAFPQNIEKSPEESSSRPSEDVPGKMCEVNEVELKHAEITNDFNKALANIETKLHDEVVHD